jgi:WD40 repeat protein
MMDMMTNQEKTLESMFRAHESLRKHLQAADPLLDNDSETASILTSTTNLTNLTVFDFDIAIKATAVYQRCMNRRSDRTSLLSLGLSTSQHTSSSKTKDTATEEKHDLASEPAIHREITEEDVSPQENCEKDTIEDISEEILRRTTPRDIQPDSSDSDSRLDSHYEYSIGESNPDYVPPMRLSIRPRDTMVAASSSETSKPTFSYSREAHMLESSSQAMETMQHYNSGLPPNRVPSGVTVGNTSAPSAANKVILNSSIVPSVKVAKPSRPGPSSEGGTQMSMRLLYDHQENITNVAISSKLVLATASPKMVRLWNLSTSKEVGKIPAKTYRYTESGLVFSPDGTLLAAAHLTTRKVTSTVSVWNPNTKARVCTLRVHNDSELRISAIAISADNKLIACSQEITRPFGEISSTTMLYEIATGHKLGEFPKLDTRTRMLSFAQEDRRLLCCSGDLVRMWNVATYRLTRFCARLGHAIYHPVFTKDSMLVSTNGFDRIYKFDWGSGVRKASITVPENIRCLSCSPGTRAIAFAGQNGLVGTWDPRTGIVRQLKQDGIHDGNVNMEAVAISPDGQTVFFGGYAGKLWSWSMDNEGHEGEHGWI